MTEQEWKGQLQKVYSALESCGITGCYSEIKYSKEDGMEQDVGKIVCRGCWDNIDSGGLLKHYKYCEKCQKTRNNKEDYLIIFNEIEKWICNFLTLQVPYTFSVKGGKKYGRRPVKVSRWRKRCIIGRKFVQRNAIPHYMLLTYMEIWMRERTGINKKNRKLCRMFLKQKGYTYWHGGKLISYWYMLQYMYYKHEKQKANRGRKLIERVVGDELEKLIEEYPFFEPEKNSDEKEGFIKLLQRHPILDIIKCCYS